MGLAAVVVLSFYDLRVRRGVGESRMEDVMRNDEFRMYREIVRDLVLWGALPPPGIGCDIGLFFEGQWYRLNLHNPNYHGTPQHSKPRPRVIKTTIKDVGVYMPDDGECPRSYDVEVRDTITNVTVDDILKQGER